MLAMVATVGHWESSTWCSLEEDNIGDGWEGNAKVPVRKDPRGSLRDLAVHATPVSATTAGTALHRTEADAGNCSARKSICTTGPVR